MLFVTKTISLLAGLIFFKHSSFNKTIEHQGILSLQISNH